MVRDRPLVFGEVLFDRFPDGSEVLGGAPFNVAWNLHGLGQAPLLVSRVGEDARGERIHAAMREFGMDCGAIQGDPQHPTGTVEVRFVDGEPHFEIVPDRAYDFIDPDRALLDLGEEESAFPLIYHGSLALRSPTSVAAARVSLDAARRREPGGKVFFDVNLRPPWWRPEQIQTWLCSADHIKLNESELDALVPQGTDLEDRTRYLLDRCEATAVYVTRGAAGAWAMQRNGRVVSTQVATADRIVDTVGAGDAFSSVLILGILQDWPLPVSLERAQEFAGAVVGLRGATTTDPAFYSRFKKMWGIS